MLLFHQLIHCVFASIEISIESNHLQKRTKTIEEKSEGQLKVLQSLVLNN